MNVRPDRIMQLASAFYESCVLFSAAELGLFKFLEEQGGADRDAIGKALGLDRRGVRLLLDACVAIDLLEKESGRYVNAPETSAFLVPGRPGDLSRAIGYNRDVYNAWGRLSDMVRGGHPVEPPETHLGDDPARTRSFVMAMHGRALGIGRMLIPLLDFSGCSKLLDIGGGSGAYAMLAAQANPGLTCTVIDLPAVAAIAEELVAQAGMSDRVICRPGDYRATLFPDGNDIVNILGVLHQESPASIVDILTRSYAALVPGGRINILDMMTDDTRCAPRFSALFAVNMALTAESGWVFSSGELEEWLTAAGFVDFECRPLPPPMPHWLATARKASSV